MLYLKFIMSDNLGSSYYYEAIHGFKFYDSTGNLITGLNSVNNLVFHTYNTRKASENTDAWFDPTEDSNVPYTTPNNSSTIDTIIIKLPTNILTKIDLYSYGNTGGSKNVDIYYSSDNIEYNFSERIIFTEPNQIISTTKIISIGYYLLKQNNKVYTFDGTNIIESDSQTIDVANFNNNGFKDPTIITEEQWNNTFPDKTGLQLLMYENDTNFDKAKISYKIDSYRPIDKFGETKVTEATFITTDNKIYTVNSATNISFKQGSVVCYSDGTVVTPDSIDYTNGTVTFNTAQTGTMTFDYIYIYKFEIMIYKQLS